ncbi:hypothetical protein Q2T40_00105 [Winogradskyella maritima]|nr:hypothetical protein [Winogradskyella maritima]
MDAGEGYFEEDVDHLDDLENKSDYPIKKVGSKKKDKAEEEEKSDVLWS